MFGLWYVVIGCAVLIVGTATLLILNEKLNWCMPDGFELTCIITLFASIIASIILIIASICIPLGAKKEVSKYELLYDSYVQYVDLIHSEGGLNGNLASNGEYMNKIMDYNTWLSDALASQKSYGCFSAYFNEDLSGFEFIKI